LRHHPAGGAGNVDRFRERPKLPAGGVELFEDSEQVFERAGHAVELPHDALRNVRGDQIRGRQVDYHPNDQLLFAEIFFQFVYASQLRIHGSSRSIGH
jgi:hypothetical protein